MAQKQKLISFKAILIGLLVLILVNILFSFLCFAFMNSIFENTGTINDENMPRILLTNPKLIIISLLELVFGAGLPGYISARIANKNFLLHGAIIGLLASVGVMYSVVSEGIFPSLLILNVLLGVAASSAGVWLRGIQLEKASAIS